MIEFLSRLFRKEKRRDKRYRVEDLSLVFPEPDSPNEAEIWDLSLGGVSFVYEDTGKRFDNVFDMDITGPDDFHTGNIRVKTLSDTEVSEVFSSTRRRFRKLSGRFINISLYQESKLMQVLKFHQSYKNQGAP